MNNLKCSPIKKLKLTDEGEMEKNCSKETSHNNNGNNSEQLKNMQITNDQYNELKLSLRDRKRKLQNCAVFHLRESGQRALLEVEQNSRTPIFLSDIQHLLMFLLIGKHSPCLPERWCYIEKSIKLSHTIVFIINGLSLYHYLAYESSFKEANDIFKIKLEIVLPPTSEGSILRELINVPLTNVQSNELIDKYGSLESAIEMKKDPTLFLKSIFPIEESVDSKKIKHIALTDKVPRTKLLLSALQMVDESYPLPLQGELKSRFHNYVFTKEKYTPVTNNSPMFAIDCEMCRTSLGFNELTRISIVNEQLETVYETLVKPSNKIVDYLTPYSGITAELMSSVTKSLQDVQKDLQNLLPPDAILIGQSLNSDLNALQMMHPYIIDTSVIFNLTGARRRKSKLKVLAMKFLDEYIQQNEDGHDPVEDSLASMKLVQKKLLHGLDYGDEILLEKKRFHKTIRAKASENILNNRFTTHRDKSSVVVTTGNLQEDIKSILTIAAAKENTINKNELKTVKYIELESNKQTIKKCRELALEHALTIASVTVSPDNLRLDSVEDTLSKVDKWIKKIYKTLAHNGILLTIMGGSVECPSGIVKICIKKDLCDKEAHTN